MNDEDKVYDEVFTHQTAEYQNARVKIVDDFHNEVVPDWDEENFKEWLKEKTKDEVYAISQYLFELWSAADTETYNR